MTRFIPPIFIFLIVATTLEACGDALVRIGLRHESLPLKAVAFLAGAALLFGYGLFLNLPPVEFGRVVGLYIATLFVVWQVVNFMVFGALPGMPVFAGGVLIVAGGLVVTFWKT
jgi:small multidrug resistance family-3 protein